MLHATVISIFDPVLHDLLSAVDKIAISNAKVWGDFHIYRSKERKKWHRGQYACNITFLSQAR